MIQLKPLTNLAFAAILFSACQKDVYNIKPINSVPPPHVINDSTDELSRGYDSITGCTNLILKPGSKKGQDTWIDYKPSEPYYADGNAGPIDQFKVLAWTIYGEPVYSRSLIRFDDLGSIPAGKNIVSAKLFLYGLSNSPVHLPKGNSSYLGSPYNSYGPNITLIQKVTSSWDENKVTWNTQPSTTKVNQVKIPASTSQWNYDVTVDVTKLVNTMIVNNGGTNYGFMLRLANESIYQSMGFYTSEASDRTKRPRLVVTYK